jgi:hypothetical protein
MEIQKMELILLILIRLIPLTLMTTIFLSLTTMMLLRLAPRHVALKLTTAWLAWKLKLSAGAASRQRLNRGALLR